MADYSQMTQEEFDNILMEVCEGDIHIPGVYESVAEYYNNEVLDIWAERNQDKAYPEEEQL